MSNWKVVAYDADPRGFRESRIITIRRTGLSGKIQRWLQGNWQERTYYGTQNRWFDHKTGRRPDQEVEQWLSKAYAQHEQTEKKTLRGKYAAIVSL